jgi:hypothetical protein
MSWDELPIATPAAWGWVIVKGSLDLPGLMLIFCLRCTMIIYIIRFGMWCHIGQASQQRQANSPMSMTSPMITLTLGPYIFA